MNREEASWHSACRMVLQAHARKHAKGPNRTISASELLAGIDALILSIPCTPRDGRIYALTDGVRINPVEGIPCATE